MKERGQVLETFCVRAVWHVAIATDVAMHI